MPAAARLTARANEIKKSKSKKRSSKEAKEKEIEQPMAKPGVTEDPAVSKKDAALSMLEMQGKPVTNEVTKNNSD